MEIINQELQLLKLLICGLDRYNDTQDDKRDAMVDTFCIACRDKVWEIEQRLKDVWQKGSGDEILNA